MYDNVTGLDGYYYLNTFENILASGVTLFELTVVNNWWIIMEGYACIMSEWSRIYFMVFYLIIMIVMAVIVAFVLEAFIFRIQYRMTINGHDVDGHSMKKVDIEVSANELQMCNNTSQLPLTGQYIASQANQLAMQEADDGVCHSVWFRGKKHLSKNDFSLRMYCSEVQDWIAEDIAASSSQDQQQTCGSSTGRVFIEQPQQESHGLVSLVDASSSGLQLSSLESDHRALVV
jgi:two pore calcium channel protein 1